MAEALLRDLAGDRFEVVSAGFEPAPVNPLVIEALAQIGLLVPRTDAQPSVFELYKGGARFRYVIGVCDEERGQRCPLFPGVGQRLNWSFPDPAAFHGPHESQLARTVEVRDAIRAQLETWLSALEDTSSSRKGTTQ